jgi:hypothetical protein
VGAELDDVLIGIELHHDGYRIVESGALICEAASPKAVVEHLHVHLFRRSLEDRPGAALLHAACLRRGHKRLLVAGTKGAGKTTLALRLVQAGYRIEGDEHVFIDGAGLIARPRGCRVKANGLPFLGEMAAMVAAAPSYWLEDVGPIFNVDPRILGSTWRIEHGDVDRVIVLEPNYGGVSSIRPLPATAMVQMLMPEVGMRETGRAATIAAIAALACRAPAFQLLVGDQRDAVRYIEAVLG